MARSLSAIPLRLTSSTLALLSANCICNTGSFWFSAFFCAWASALSFWSNLSEASATNLDSITSVSAGRSALCSGKGTPNCFSISRRYWNATCSCMWAAAAAWIALAAGAWPNASMILGSWAAATCTLMWLSWSWWTCAFTGSPVIRAIFSATGSFGFISSSRGIIFSTLSMPITSIIWRCNSFRS